jgi:hypothetical protein
MCVETCFEVDAVAGGQLVDQLSDDFLSLLIQHVMHGLLGRGEKLFLLSIVFRLVFIVVIGLVVEVTRKAASALSFALARLGADLNLEEFNHKLS